MGGCGGWDKWRGQRWWWWWAGRGPAAGEHAAEACRDARVGVVGGFGGGGGGVGVRGRRGAHVGGAPVDGARRLHQRPPRGVSAPESGRGVRDTPPSTTRPVSAVPVPAVRLGLPA